MSEDTKPDPSSTRLATDASHPSVSVIRTVPSYEDSKLSTTHSNYRDWAWGIRNNLEEAGLWDYVTGTSLAPDSKSEPRAYSNWLSNNTTAKAFIIKNVDPHDARHHELRDCATAKDLWVKIQTSFGKYSPAEQVNLIDKCLNATLVNDGTAIAQVDKLIEDGKRAHEALTENTWLCLLIMKAMSRDPIYAQHKSIAEHAISEAEIRGDRDIFTANSLRNMIVLLHNNALATGTTTSPSALAAQHTHTAPSAKKERVPIKCSNCKKDHHTAEFCIAKGGGMEGKTREESKEARKRAREAKDGNSGASPSKDTAVVASANIVTTTPFALPSTNITNSTQLDAQLAASTIQYEGWVVQTYDDNALAAQTSDGSTLSPYIADSGASVHLSPYRADFTTFHPLSPRSIKGVGGDISAVGIGNITLQTSPTASITLMNALYVPKAAIRLVSMKALATDLKLVVRDVRAMSAIIPLK
ncbi:hypothetical protein CVT24_009523, partial [Panaeolus cyanescens]